MKPGMPLFMPNRGLPQAPQKSRVTVFPASLVRLKRAGVPLTVTCVRGNIAPEGGVMKTSGVHKTYHQGPARVFDREEDAAAAVARVGATTQTPGSHRPETGFA